MTCAEDDCDNPTTGKQKYCSNACKMKGYRKRQHDGPLFYRVETPEFSVKVNTDSIDKLMRTLEFLKKEAEME